MCQTTQRIDSYTEKNYIDKLHGQKLNLRQISFGLFPQQLTVLSRLIVIKLWRLLKLEIELVIMNKRKAKKIVKHGGKNMSKLQGIKYYEPRVLKKAHSICLHENAKIERSQFLIHNYWS
jgi:hypothetical protein